MNWNPGTKISSSSSSDRAPERVICLTVIRVVVDGDSTIVIKGTIDGSGPIKKVGITITLKKHSGHFTFFFLLDNSAGNPPIIVTETGGAVVETSN